MAEEEEELIEEEPYDLFGDHPGTVARASLVVLATGAAEQNYRVGSFSVPPTGDEIEATVNIPIIAVALVNGLLLVAVPSSAWHRLQRQRVLPPNSLAKAVAVEVAAVQVQERDQIVEGFSIRIWIGLLKAEYEERLVFPAPFGTSVVFPTTDGSEDFLPAADALVAICDEKFAFLTAESGSMRGAEARGQSARIAALEENVVQIKTMLQDLKSPAAAPASSKLKAVKFRRTGSKKRNRHIRKIQGNKVVQCHLPSPA